VRRLLALLRTDSVPIVEDDEATFVAFKCLARTAIGWKVLGIGRMMIDVSANSVSWRGWLLALWGT
jgi:hypothetical protein